MKVTLLAICLFLWVAGCQPIANENNKMGAIDVGSHEPTPNLQNSPPILPTISTLQVVTQVITPISLSTNFVTPLPTSLPLPTNTITLTPLPTLSPSEAANKIMALLADNQNPNCLLPCWWGAVPGQTPWQDIEPFLRSFTKIDDSSLGTSFGASVTLPLLEPIAAPNSGDYYVFYSWDNMGIIQRIAIDSINISGYDAKTMVTLYGVPDEVWLNTRDSPVQGVLPFQLIVVYQQKGVSFRYYLRATKIGEMVTACFPPGVVEQERPDIFPVGPRLFLWTPGVYKSIGEISPIPWERYFSLESKTDLTPQTLYEKFSNPNEPPCIETPAELWKYQ